MTTDVFEQLEFIKQDLFDKDNRDPERLEKIENKLIEMMALASGNEKQAITALRNECRKKWLYWKYPPKLTKAKPGASDVIEQYRKTIDKQDKEGLLF